MTPSLPSEIWRPGRIAPAGFETKLTPEHWQQSAEALAELAKAVTMPADPNQRELSVNWSSYELLPGLTFRLFAFGIYDIDADGTVNADYVDGKSVRYSLCANLPVSLQREAAIGFLHELLGRYQLVSDAASDQELFASLPTAADKRDEEQRRAANRALRPGWPAAVQSLQAAAAAAGVRFSVLYSVDPIPDPEELSRRVPVLRRLYNKVETVRDCADRWVSMFRAQNLAVSGADPEMLEFVERRLSALELRHFINQTLRDAFVCGNGYLRFFTEAGEPRLRNLRPETIRIEGEQFIELKPGGGHSVIPEHVLHLRGVNQRNSPYGVSPFEAALFVLQWHDMLDSYQLDSATMRARGLTLEQLRELEETEGTMQAGLSRALKRLDELLVHFKALPEPATDLYFAGQQSLSE